MAEQSLIFKIGSVFSGEGFKALKGSVKDTNASLKQSIASTSALASAFGNLDNKTAQALGAMGDMLGALVTLNGTAIIAQAAMYAFTSYTKKLQDEVAELAKRSEAMRQSVDKSFGEILKRNVAEATNEVKAIAAEFDAVTKRAEAFTAALNSLNTSQRAGSVVDLELEKLNAMLEAHSEEERKQIEATHNLRIATEKAALSQEEWADKIAAENEKYVNTQQRIIKYDEQISVIQAKRAELEEIMLTAKESGDERWKKINEEIIKLGEEEAALRRGQKETWGKLAVADLALQKAREDAANAEVQSTIAIRQAMIEQTKLNEAKAAAAEKVRQETAEREEKIKKSKELASLRSDAADMQREVNESARRLRDAENDYAKALADYSANFAENRMQEVFFGANTKSHGMQRGYSPMVINALTGEIVQDAVEKAIKNGDVKTVKDLFNYEKQVMRQAKTDVNSAKVQAGREKQRFERLREQNRKTWSKADTEFYTRYEKLKEHAEAAKREIEEKKQRLAEEQRQLQENHDNLKKIKEKLEELGAA